MLLATRESARWRRRSLVALAALAAAYWYAGRESPEPLRGGSPIGLAYGVLGLLAILALLWFGVRKRSYRSTWGRLETWLHVHVYLGLLCVFVVLFHSGFRFQDRVAVAAFAALAVVAVSGLAGALLYTTVPRQLTPLEGDATPEEIAGQLDQLARSMARLASGKSAALQRVYRGLVARSLPRRLAGWRLLWRGGFRPLDPAALSRAHLGRVDAAEQADLRQLLVLYRQHQELHRRLAAQQRYRNLLDVWLWVHLPFSVVLVVLVAAHLVGALLYSSPF